MNSAELLPRKAPREPVPLGLLSPRPLVSIVVPSFRQGRFIKDTIESILNQDYRPVTIHVIDGGSTDETVDVLKSYGDIPELRWVSEKDRGVVHAVNKGFAQVQGEIIAIQSSDDMYTPGTLARVVQEFQNHPPVGLIYGDTIKVDADGKDLLRVPLGPYTLENLLLMKTWIPQPSAFFRREMLDACGGWDETIPYAPDTDLWLRMAFRAEVRKLDTYLSQRRMHEAQRDTQKSKIIRDYTQMIRQSPDIAAASPAIQAAAQVGCHLIQIRYNTGGSAWTEFWHKWQAKRLRSDALPWSSVLKSGLLPFRMALSKLKRTIWKS